MSAPKQPLNNNGSIIIRFTHNGYRYNLSRLGEYTNPIALKYAQSICDRIKMDIINNSFNCENNQELILRYNPTAIHTTLNSKIIKNIDEKNIKIDLRIKCIDKLQNTEKVVEKNILKHLTNYTKKIEDKKDIKDFVEWLKKERKLSGISIARYFDVLKTLDDNFRNITIEKTTKPKPAPFSKKEVQDILLWFEKNNKQYFYYVKFLFLTGCRTSEAIGLRWKHIDLENRIIYFYETLARNNNNSAKRIVKSTKQNIMRKFPINNKLFNMLSELHKVEKEALVFTFNEHCIDDKNFCNRHWKKCLKECGIEYRKPYTTRHTFISHFLEETKDVVKCASLTHGSKSGIKTIYDYYANIINKVEVPDLF